MASLSDRSIKWRLFFTCWLVYLLHFATDFSREHYLVVSIVEDHSFRLDKYLGFHPDIFQTTDHGAHHGANPGISMIAAVPYFFLRPAVDAIVRRELAHRPPGADTATYNDPRPWRVKFFNDARRTGVDVRFGLVAAITLATCMAPLSAASAVVMFQLLGVLGLARRIALGGALLYALGTPIFFRTAFLNQNLALGLFGFIAFVLLWDPGHRSRLRPPARLGLAGLLGGLCFLSDYSGAIILGLLGVYALLRQMDTGTLRTAFRESLWYAAGAAPPMLLLWWYQYQSFGNWFYPPQHHMPKVEWIEVGYKGVGGPNGELLSMLLFDPYFGLFVAAPLLLLALAAPILNRRRTSIIPARETGFILLFSVVFIVFFSSVQYTRLQAITGIRYIVPVIPFLFLPAFAVLVRLPRGLAYGIGLGSFVLAWCNAMVRPNDFLTIAGSVKAVFLGGFQLPWLTTLSKLSSAYAPGLTASSPLPLLGLAGVVVALLWGVRKPGRPVAEDG